MASWEEEGGRALERADKVTDEHGWCDADAKMHVCFDAPDLVDIDVRRIDAATTDVVVHNGLDLGCQERSAGLGMPDEMEVDFGVIITAHLRSPRKAEAELREAP